MTSWTEVRHCTPKVVPRQMSSQYVVASSSSAHYRHCRHPNPSHHHIITRNTLPTLNMGWITQKLSISNSTKPRPSHLSLTILQRGAQTVHLNTVAQTEWSPRCLPRLNLAYFFWPQRQAAGHVTMFGVAVQQESL